MIKISRPLPSYRVCNGCRQSDDVREVIISFEINTSVGIQTSGTAITLCKNCRKELMNVLKGADDEGER